MRIDFLPPPARRGVRTHVLHVRAHSGALKTGDGLDVLAMEVSVQCGKEAHRTAVYVGFATVALVTVGTPLQAFLLMRAVRERLDDAPNAVRYGFFFLNYRREVYWYECAALFRKAALVATVVLFEDRLGVQVFSVSLVSTVFLTVHTYSKPYTLTALNNLETFALFVSTVTLSSTSFFYGTRYTGSIDRTYELGLSWAIILMSVGLLAASAWLIAKDLRRARQRGGNHLVEGLLRLAPGGGSGVGGGLAGVFKQQGSGGMFKPPRGGWYGYGAGEKANGLEAGEGTDAAGGLWFAAADGGEESGAGDGGDASVVHENPVLGVTRGNGKARGNGRGERTSVSNPLAGGAGAGTGWGDEYDLFLAGGGKRD